MAFRIATCLSVVTAMVATVGCNQPVVESGPSYAELVITYNAEMETLDRLERKREELVKAYTEAEIARKADSKSLSLDDAMDVAKRMASEIRESDVPANPDALLGELAKRTGGVDEVADKLIGGLLGESKDEPKLTPEEIEANEKRQSEHEDKIAKLDEEIAAQKERVDRARAARDSAEQNKADK